MGGEKFSGFGLSVPDKIRECVNLGELNIQRPLDKPFLITDSPGEIARTINRITNLDKSDQYIKLTGSELRRNKQRLEAAQTQKEDIEERLKAFDGIESLGSIFDKAKKAEEEIAAFEKLIDEGLDLLADIADIDDRLAQSGLIDKLLKIDGEIESTSEEVHLMQENLRLLREFAGYCREVEIHEQYLEVFELLPEKIAGFGNKLSAMEADIELFNQYLEYADDTNFAEDKYEKLKGEFLNMAAEMGTCPFCGSLLDTDKGQHYLEGCI
jgi:exonuclease SbcC